MPGLMRILVPLVFLGVVVVRIILSFKEMQKRESQRRKQGGEKGEWTHVADAGEIRRFLKEAQQGARGGPAQQKPRPVRRGPAGLPPGAVTPGGPRKRREAANPPAAPKPAAGKRTRRRARTLAAAPPAQRAAPGSRFDAREPHVKNIVEHVKAHKFEGPQGTPKGKLATKLRRKAQQAKAVPAPPAASVAPSVPKPGTVEETEALVPTISRQSLRRAIVMSEVLGKPIGMRAP